MEMVVSVNGFSMVVDPRDEVVGAHLIHGKAWEPYETELFTKSITPGMVVVDVGANIGYYTLLAARAVGPEGAVVAFEPDPVNFKLLSRNVASNGLADRVALVQCAVADRNGTVTLFHDRDNFGAHSFAEKNLVRAGSVEVSCSTLAEALGEQGLDYVDLLKVDVQGAEGLVFEGAKKVLAYNRIRIFMEYWPSGLRRVGTDPVQLLRMLASECHFRMSWIDEEDSRLVKFVDPEKVTARCGEAGHVNLVLERS
jgi:FkbM family methyltransferase